MFKNPEVRFCYIRGRFILKAQTRNKNSRKPQKSIFYILSAKLEIRIKVRLLIFNVYCQRAVDAS